MKAKFLICCALLIPFIIMGQRVIEGTVKNSESGELLADVSIKVKDTSVSTTTDADGRFSITVPAGYDVLVFSYLGFAVREVVLSEAGGAHLDILLQPESVGLNAVVISASKKREKLLDAPASVSVINTERIETQIALTSIDYLKTTPGVDIMRTSLVASNVVPRGFNNTFSGDMLVLTDNRITGVPSLKVNVFQLNPINNMDIEKIEVVRGPGSALYGPNAANGVMHIITKSPLDLKKKTETTVSFAGGERAVINPELRFAYKINDKVAYKISGWYMQANDWEYYDPREPTPGDTVIYGSVRNGQVFQPDSTLSPEPFDRDFLIRNYSGDMRFDFKITNDLQLILNGGAATLNNIQLAEIGAGQGINWRYYYAQARLKWKELFVQYYLNSSNAGDTYIIPQVGDASPPHNVQLLIDDSKLHVIQVQHNYRPFKKMDLTYGADVLLTRPETGSTIHGRFEQQDNTNQAGGYLQAEYNVIPKVTLVGAARLDWHDEISGVFVSPRAAVVYKPHLRHTLRATYNRAFSTPSTLNLFFDLSNGFIPNGINLRGIGNAHGFNYKYNDAGEPLFISPYTAQWYEVNDRSDNHRFFDGMLDILSAGMAAKYGLPAPMVQTLMDSLMMGISKQTGTINSAGHIAVDFVKLITTGDLAASQYDLSTIDDINELKNSETQTWELGYKGMLFDKLSLTADFYHTRVSNLISPVTIATASVMLSPAQVVAALGAPSPGGLLYDNLQQPSPVGGTLDQLLTGLIDGQYPDPTGNIPSKPGTSWDEIAVILAGASGQIPIGSVTPVDNMVNADIILTYKNLGTVDVSGMDIGFTFHAAKEVNLSGFYSFLSDNKIDLEGAQFGYIALNAPQHKVALTAEYRNKKIRLTPRITWRWQDAFPVNSAIYVGNVKAANFIDLQISYELPVWKRTVITLDIQNLLNYKHQGMPYTPEMGRLALGKIMHTF